MSRRKHIPLLAQLHAALYQLGFEPHEVELDHTPALAMRPIDPATGDTIPPANDPKALIWRPIADHRRKTFGPGGDKRITTAGSDIHAIAKVKRIERDPSGGEEFRRKLLAREPKPERRAKRKWPSRPFTKRQKP